MKITDEQIQRLMRYTNASEAEARRALEQADGDILNALELLLGGGRRRMPRGSRLRWVLREVWRFLVENRFVVYNPHAPSKIECPVAALLALLVLAWYAVLFFLLLAICAGWKFRVEGPQLGRERVNRALDALNTAVGQLRNRVNAKLKRLLRELRRRSSRSSGRDSRDSWEKDE